MSILPNLTPKKSSPPSPAGEAQQPTAPGDGGKMGETLRLLFKVWAVMIGLEFIHQIFNLIMTFMDPSALREVAAEQAQAEGLSESMVDATVVAAALVMGLFNLIVIAILLWMVQVVRKHTKRTPTAFMLLTIFSFFFILRTLTLFFASPGGLDIPIALYAVDGCIQILIGVSAGLAYALSRSEESLKWLSDSPKP
ncbi:hypothetical protein SFC07_03310 [Corynebacterium callunae]|uniref:hypothetical protein n=1 Tax=Corynebacterium callunae TaxID=1721 RepID=UPI00398226FB